MGIISDLTPDNNLVDRQTGFEFALAPSGAIETGELIRLIGGNFETGGLLSNIWSTNITGSASATAITGELILSTGTNANSIAEVQSAKRARFVTATFNKAHIGVTMPNFSNPDLVREVGMFDPVSNIISGDGIFFRNDGGNVFIVQRKAGVDNVIPEANWNGYKTDSGLRYVKNDNITLIEIVYNAGAVLFYQGRRLLHRFSFGSSIGYETVHLPVAARIENKNGNTTNNQLNLRALSCSRIGSSAASPDYVTVNSTGTVTIKRSPGTLRRVVVTNIGGGNSRLRLYDSGTGTTGQFAEIELTRNLTTLSFDLDFTNGLTYTATGSNFECILVFD